MGFPEEPPWDVWDALSIVSITQARWVAGIHKTSRPEKTALKGFRDYGYGHPKRVHQGLLQVLAFPKENFSLLKYS